MQKTDSFDGILTFTGTPFRPWDPDPDNIFLTDIAHALSLQNRWNGHTRLPVCVAEHSLNVLKYVTHRDESKAIRIQALLHDATEAYLPDLTSPVKHRMSQFQEMEAKVWDAICIRFGIETEMRGIVEEADREVFYYEYHTSMNRSDDIEIPVPKQPFTSVHSPATRTPHQWKHEFMKECSRLGIE